MNEAQVKVCDFFLFFFFSSCCLISTVFRNCSTRQLDPSRKSPSITTRTAVQKVLPQLPSKRKEMEPRLFNNTITDSSMAVSIASPLTPHLLHVVAIGIFVLRNLLVAVEPWLPVSFRTLQFYLVIRSNEQTTNDSPLFLSSSPVPPFCLYRTTHEDRNRRRPLETSSFGVSSCTRPCCY